MIANKTLSLLLAVTLGAFSASAAMATDFLADKHAGKSVSCVACHKSAAPKTGDRGSMDRCIGCHGDLKKVSDTIAAKKKIDPDPHWSHMVALRCDECHRGHQPGVNMCARCHKLDYKIP